MFIRDFNPNSNTKLDKVNNLLKEHFGMSITSSFPKKAKLEKIAEMSDQAIMQLKSSTKQFQLHPEYAKYMGVKYVVKEMIAEGKYAESPKYHEMKEMLMASVQELMDSGYTMDEASAECMNRYRMDNRYAYKDDDILPIIITAAKDYVESCSGSRSESLEEIAVEGPSTDLNEYLLSELAKEVGVELTDPSSIDAIEEKLGLFAEVSGKSRDSVVGFLNGLEEDALPQGIKFFGAKVREQNKFTGARKDAILQGKDEFEVDGETYKVTGDTKDEKKQAKESMFDDIIDDMLSEEIEGTSVEEAEVVMAVRALADDIQDHVERLGRMVNEDIPAIADQMIHEFGADKAAQFKESAEQTLSTALESAKQAKDGVNELVGSITGEDMGLMGGADDMGSIEDPIGADSPIDDMGVEELPEPEIDVNEPAAAGPEEEPLGRAPIEA